MVQSAQGAAAKRTWLQFLILTVVLSVRIELGAGA